MSGNENSISDISKAKVFLKKKGFDTDAITVSSENIPNWYAASMNNGLKGLGVEMLILLKSILKVWDVLYAENLAILLLIEAE